MKKTRLTRTKSITLSRVSTEARPVRTIGHTLCRMLHALSCRRPDSAGVAVFGPRQGFLVLQIKYPESLTPANASRAIVEALRETVAIIRHQIIGAYLRLEVESATDVVTLEEQLLLRAPGCEIVSLGHQLEIVKQVGSPAQLEKTYGISQRLG